MPFAPAAVSALDVCSLRSGVDEVGPDFLVFCPRWDEAPALEHCPWLINRFLLNGENRLTGRDVKAALRLHKLEHWKGVLQALGIGAEREAAAHWQIVRKA
jgi:hypothetical protein